MVHHPMWVGTVRSCMALPGFNVSVLTFGLLAAPITSAGPDRADQMCGHILREIRVLRSSACGENHM